MTVDTLDRAKYWLEYPSTWHIDSTEKGYSIESRFSIYPPYKSAVCMFFFIDKSLDEREFLNAQIKAQLDKSVKNGKVTYFERWGSLDGQGAIIKGDFLGILEGTLSVFCRSTDSSTFMVLHQYSDHMKNKILPGLEKIKSTFKLKK